MLKNEWKILILLFLISIGILISSITYGQTVEILSESGNTELIDEFKNIMEVPEDERSIEQWNRAIEIIFTIYKSGNINALMLDLQYEIDKYSKLIAQLEKLTSDLEAIYNAESKTLNELTILRDSLKEAYNNLNIRNNFYTFAKAGYSINFGLNFGLGFAFPFGNFLIGGFIDVDTNFKDLTLTSINLLIGWGF